MRESCTSGSGRGDRGNPVPYRHRDSAVWVRLGERRLALRFRPFHMIVLGVSVAPRAVMAALSGVIFYSAPHQQFDARRGSTKPQCYRETSGLRCGRERECGHSRRRVGPKRERLNRSYFSQLLRLTYLAPDITTAILDGHQPAGLTTTMLIGRADLPMSWREQRRALGFA
jgi:hypothetical protein